jgi:hypothetical protein
VVRLESATYEIIECEHDVSALTKAFKGAKVVCNTVGPFVNFGLVGVEAALKAASVVPQGIVLDLTSIRVRLADPIDVPAAQRALAGRPQEHVWKAGRANVTHNKFGSCKI